MKAGFRNRFAGTGPLLTAFGLELSLNEICKMVVLNHLGGQVLCPFDHAEANGTPAIALERLVHVPFG